MLVIYNDQGLSCLSESMVASGLHPLFLVCFFLFYVLMGSLYLFILSNTVQMKLDIVL